jgi:hypothetical protein
LKDGLNIHNDNIKRKYPMEYQTLWKDWYAHAIKEFNYILLNTCFLYLKLYKSNVRDDTCVICHEDINFGVKTRCGHHFHDKCIIEWLKQNNKCPLCRGEIVG